MNFNSARKKSNFETRDSIGSEKYYYNTDTKNKSLKKEEDNFFAVNISKTSQEMRNKYYENSEVKSKTIKNNNENESSNNNTFNLTNKKYTFSSQKSNYEIASKQSKKSEKTDNIPYQETNSPIKNDNSSKNILQNKISYPTELITNYKFWKGSNYFPFKAKMIEGPQSFRPTLMTGTAITIGILFFLIFESEYLNDEITIFIPILISLIYLAILYFLIIASFCEPGIIRRFDIKDDNNIDINFKQKKAKNKERISSRIFQLGNIMNYKYCYTCGIIRPNRSTHCADCNNCVERLDHHCPWIGNCAGKRNYIYFFIFLTLLNILQILVMIFCLIHIIQQIRDDSDLNDKLPLSEKKEHITSFSFCEVTMSLYLIIYNIFFMFFTVPLIIYHINLILTDTTTKEKLRGAFYHGNPFSRSKIQNIKNVLNPVIKKHSILEILRGDFKEICDKNNKNENDQNQNPNETEIKLNLNTLTNEVEDELKLDKINEKPNSNIINISGEKEESQNNNFHIKNNMDIFQEKNNDIISMNAPEPLDTTIGHSDDKGIEIKNNKFFSNSSPKIREFVENFGKRKIIDDEK